MTMIVEEHYMVTLAVTRLRIPCPSHYCFVICKPHGLQLSLTVDGYYMETLPSYYLYIESMFNPLLHCFM